MDKAFAGLHRQIAHLVVACFEVQEGEVCVCLAAPVAAVERVSPHEVEGPCHHATCGVVRCHKQDRVAEGGAQLVEEVASKVGLAPPGGR